MFTAPLLTGPVPLVLGLLGLVALGWLAVVRDRRWWVRWLPLAAGIAALVTAALVGYVEKVWQPFPDALPPEAILSGGAVVLALLLAAFRWPSARWRVRLTVLPLCFVLVAAAAASEVNVFYGQYPTLRALLPGPQPNQVRLNEVPPVVPVASAPAGGPVAKSWHAPAGLPAHGVVAESPIPGAVSGFAARPAMIYLPPAYLTTPRAELPVLVLMSGSPGAPSSWFGAGRLAERMDRFAAAHHGLAPVVVVPDILGKTFANPLCLDSRLGRSATYVDQDVPAWIKANLQVDPDAKHWAIGGLSSGGTCALQAAVRSPQVYPTMLDFSGQDEPALGNRSRTIRATFGGDRAAFDRASPLRQLAGRKLPGTAAMVTVGDKDHVYGPQQRRVQKALQRAGARVEFALIPGGHTWAVFGGGFDKSLPWLAPRLGLT